MRKLFSLVSAILITAVRSFSLYVISALLTGLSDPLFLLLPTAVTLFSALRYSKEKITVGKTLTAEKGLIFRKTYSIQKSEIRYIKLRKTPLEYLFGVCRITVVAKGVSLSLPFVKDEISEKLK